MEKSDVKELYSISTEKGVLILIKRDVEKWLSSADEYASTPDMLVNPKIRVLDNGVMKVSGLRLSFTKVRNIQHYNWIPKPVSEMKENWADLIFHEDTNIIQRDVVEWEPILGFWPFKKRVKTKVDHLKPAWYLSKTGYVDTQATSNYRLVGFKELELNGVIR